VRLNAAWIVLAILPWLGACTGAKGDTGPMGPSGAGTPVYYYNNSFDSGGVSEWHTYLPGGAGTVQVYLDSQVFISPGQCLAVSVTGSIGLDSLVYTSLNINPNLDCWTEFDWDMQGATSEGFEFFEFMGGDKKNAVIGFDSTNLYLVQGSGEVDIAPQPAVGYWHHVTIKIDAVTKKSSYWMDGLTLGTGYQTSESVQGTPPSGYLIGISARAGDQSVNRMDNLKCYHY
jgi:hypothetical protein